MSKTFSGEKVVKILCREFGFFEISQKGSHVKLAKSIGGKKVSTVVPKHKELARGTLKGALDLALVDYNKFISVANKIKK
jgi:predicted RNA binding protein YcfA (HicA-like mRNA interferase family)